MVALAAAVQAALVKMRLTYPERVMVVVGYLHQ
jgi:hypothetical protein